MSLINNVILHLDMDIDIELKECLLPKQPKECDYGNREYKLKLINCNADKIIKRSTQMLYRIYEGCGKAVYLIGIDDYGNIIGLTYNELMISLNNFIKVLNKSKCNIKKLVVYKIDNKYIMVIRIFKNLESNNINDLICF